MKKILIFTVLVSMFCTLSAQRRNYRTVDVFDNNVELSVSGGLQALHLVQETPVKGLKDELTPMVQFSVGYHFSPILGTRIAIQGGNTQSALGDTILPNSLIYTHADLLVELTNFWKAKPKRRKRDAVRLYYDATIVFGAGFITLRPEEVKDQFTGFAMNGGLINSFSFNEKFWINLEAKLLLTNDAFPADYHLNYGGWAMNYDVSLGFSYKIATDQKHKRYTGRRR
ncbi:MAG: hypothetical protein II298_00510 [Bacteroidales bacterium]|nr:hypothetical protein [Bacteroidales bacterium]